MILGSFYFRQKARAALKGNWQTALLVTFFSGIFMTLASLIQSASFPDVVGYASMGAYDALATKMREITPTVWGAFSALNFLSFLFSPVLAVSSNHYFVRRLQGEELGFKGLWSRMASFGRSLWLFIMMGVRIFLWSLLLIVPGIIAAIRYSMAAYYLAEDPALTATQAIEKSKDTMRELKMSYFSLMLSFYGWMLLSTLAQMMLLSINVVFALVAAQFMQLAISTYMNAACASFFLTVSSTAGMQSAKDEMRERMRQMGVDPAAYEAHLPLENDDGVQTDADEALDLEADEGSDDGGGEEK